MGRESVSSDPEVARRVEIERRQQLMVQLQPHHLNHDQGMSLSYFLGHPGDQQLTIDLGEDTDTGSTALRCLVVSRAEDGYKVEERTARQVEDKEIGDEHQLGHFLKSLNLPAESQMSLSLGAFHAREEKRPWSVTCEHTPPEGGVTQRLKFTGTPEGVYRVKIYQ